MAITATSDDDAVCQAKRDRIVEFGKQLSDQGAHYLWGAEGQTPDEGKACRFAPIVLNAGTPQLTTFNAAVINSCVCVGRFRHPSLANVAPLRKVSTGSEPQLASFIANTDPDSQSSWGFDLTPRLISGYANSDGAPIDYGQAGNLVGKVVWGEGCGATQHFDCGGFVRYVVRKVCGGSIAGVSQLIHGAPVVNAYGLSMGRLLAEGEPITPGDILVYHGHIAFSLSGAKLSNAGSGAATPYSKGARYTILQAESAVFGLNYDKSRGGHTGCIRLSRSTLLGGPNL